MKKVVIVVHYANTPVVKFDVPVPVAVLESKK